MFILSNWKQIEGTFVYWQCLLRLIMYDLFTFFYLNFILKFRKFTYNPKMRTHQR